MDANQNNIWEDGYFEQPESGEPEKQGDQKEQEQHHKDILSNLQQHEKFNRNRGNEGNNANILGHEYNFTGTNLLDLFQPSTNPATGINNIQHESAYGSFTIPEMRNYFTEEISGQNAEQFYNSAFLNGEILNSFLYQSYHDSNVGSSNGYTATGIPTLTQFQQQCYYDPRHATITEPENLATERYLVNNVSFTMESSSGYQEDYNKDKVVEGTITIAIEPNLGIGTEHNPISSELPSQPPNPAESYFSLSEHNNKSDPAFVFNTVALATNDAGYTSSNCTTPRLEEDSITGFASTHERTDSVQSDFLSIAELQSSVNSSQNNVRSVTRYEDEASQTNSNTSLITIHNNSQIDSSTQSNNVASSSTSIKSSSKTKGKKWRCIFGTCSTEYQRKRDLVLKHMIPNHLHVRIKFKCFMHKDAQERDKERTATRYDTIMKHVRNCWKKYSKDLLGNECKPVPNEPPREMYQIYTNRDCSYQCPFSNCDFKTDFREIFVSHLFSEHDGKNKA